MLQRIFWQRHCGSTFSRSTDVVEHLRYTGLSVYGTRSRSRPSPTGNRSCFCEANNFFTSASNELKLRIQIDCSLNYTFLKLQKCKKYSSNIFKRFPPKKICAQISENCCESCILYTSYTYYYMRIPSQSIFSQYDCLQYFKFPCFIYYFYTALHTFCDSYKPSVLFIISLKCLV